MTTIARTDVAALLETRSRERPGSGGAEGPSCAQACVCSHCALPVPAGLVEVGAEEQFCCAGCRGAWAIIHDGGLERFYALRDGAKAGAVQPGEEAARREAFSEFDDEVFQSLYCARCAGGSLRSVELMVEGVHCAACVWLLEKLPALVPGVVESRLSFRTSTLRVTWDAESVKLSGIARTLAQLGYKPHPARGVRGRDVKRAEDRRALVRIAVAGACAGNVMLLYAALYAGLFSAMDAAHVQLFRWASMGLSLIAMLWPGSVFFVGAWRAVRARALTLDVPIALGFGAGLVWGVVNTVRGGGDTYFDSLAALVFFLLVGRFVQSRQQRMAADALEMLFSLTPASAWLVEGESVTRVPTQALRVGQVVEVRGGESFPVDGVVEGAGTFVDASTLTGEARPVRVEAGGGVFAGTLNVGGRVRAIVEQTGEATRVGKLMRLVEDGARTKGAIGRFADRFASWFLVVILALCAVTLALWWQRGPAAAWEYAIALLIATCPCGLGLATPLVMTSALGRASSRGLLVKTGLAVEQLGARAPRRTMLLDKTGTLTLGRTTLRAVRGSEGAWAMAGEVEAQGAHHAARAVVEGTVAEVARARAAQGAAVVTGVREHAGRGVEGVVAYPGLAGRLVRVGTAEFVGATGADIARLGAAEAAAASALYVSVDGVVEGAGELGDVLREDARASVDALRARGWRVRIASGDAPGVVRAIGACLGIADEDCLGGLTPEGKLALVRAERSRGLVVMVGDGVNDAPALSEAGVGVAVHGGAEASLHAADVYLTRGGVAPIVELVDGAHKAMRALVVCIVVSIAYNVVVAALAMMGKMSPLLAAILMPAASLSVLTLALRLPTYRVRRAAEEAGSAGALEAGGAACQ